MSAIDGRLSQLVDYGVERGLIQPEDRVWARNSMLAVLNRDAFEEPLGELPKLPLERILGDILDWAEAEGLISGQTERDLLDTRLMGVMTPRPSAVIAEFRRLYAESPETATDWFYALSRASDYIREYRVAKDIKWQTVTEYGALDITINLSKPEKDPKAIAAAGLKKASGYPKCLLCREAEGYAGRADYPARENHRLIPMQLCGQPWYFQYSPYVYYNEHCIVLNEKHIPMRIDRAAFERLLDFTAQFPHYFIGSNADLPIVGGSILSHDHFQGGRYEFAMARAEVERELHFKGYEDVGAGIVRWPMSVIRLRCGDRERLAELADIVLSAWRGYSDERAGILACTRGEAHNTVTPIARRRGEDYELDLVLRNNLCTEEYPLGVFHPHEELHHIKKENIGLIEVMGLAILPPRLLPELHALEKILCGGGDLRGSELTIKHADWAEELKTRYDFTEENVREILRRELGLAFKRVLEQAGVFRRTEAGQDAFMRFIDSIGR